MDRENDIFDQPSKVRKMNMTNDEAPQRRVRNVSQADPRSASPAPARNARQMAQAPQGQMRRRPEGAQSAPARPQRSAASATRPAQSATPSGRPASANRPQRSAASNARPAQGTAPAARPAQSAPRKAALSNTQPSRPVSSQQRPAPQERQSAPNAQSVRQAATNAQTAARQAAMKAQSARQNAPSKAQPAPSERTDSVRTQDRPQRGGKKKSGFKKFILIYSAILLVILVAGLIVFNSFIKKYEDNQPTNVIASIVDDFQKGKAASFLNSHSDKIQCLENVDTIIDQAVSGIDGKQISFIENKDYRADSPSYNVTADGNIIAKITLGKDSKGAFGLSSWKVTGLDIASFVPNTLSYNILTLENSKVSINGTELSDTYKVSDAGIPTQLETASKFVQVPNFVTYKVSGFTNPPSVTATGSDGSALGVSQTSNSFVCGTTTTQEFIDSVSGLVDHAIEAWGKHFINMGGGLSNYILDGCDYYGYIFGSDTMDPIYTSFYEFESIADYEFTEKSATNYIRYTENCFTVDVKYQMRVDFTTDRMSDNNQKLDATWVFITQNGGQDWYIVDCIYKS